MKSKLPRYAGIVAAILAIALIAGLFAIFGTVDLIFVKDGYEVKRTENVSVLSDIELYAEEGAELQYTYEFDGAEYVINEDQANLKEHIVYTVLLNAITFKWGAEDNDITVTVE